MSAAQAFAVSATTSCRRGFTVRFALATALALALLPQLAFGASDGHTAAVGQTGPANLTFTSAYGGVTVSIANVTTPGTFSFFDGGGASAAATANTWVQVGTMNYQPSFTGATSGQITYTVPYSPLMPNGRAAQMVVRAQHGTSFITIKPAVDTANRLVSFGTDTVEAFAVLEPKDANRSLNAAAAFDGTAAMTLNPDYDSSSALVCMLTDPTGQPVSSKNVVLQKLNGKAWVDVAVVPAVSAGKYAYSVSAMRKMHYRFHVPADGFTNDALSSTLRLYPLAKVTLSIAPQSVKTKQAFVIRGRVLPKRARGSKVKLQFIRYDYARSRWVVRYTKTVKLGKSSKYSYRTKIREKGYWAVCAIVKGNSTSAGHYSAYDPVRVK